MMQFRSSERDENKANDLHTSNDIHALTNWTRGCRTRGGCVLDLAHPVLWRRTSFGSPGCDPTPSPGAGMKGFAGSQDLFEKLTRSKPRHEINNINETGNPSEIHRCKPGHPEVQQRPITKDSKHIPSWDMKIQREFEANIQDLPSTSRGRPDKGLKSLPSLMTNPTNSWARWEMTGPMPSGTNWSERNRSAGTCMMR